MASAVATKDQIASVDVSQAAVLWHRFRKHRAGLIALAVLLLLVLLVIFVPILSPFDYAQRNPALRFGTIGSADPETGQIHILGTDPVGRDIMTRLFMAGRISLALAFTAAIACVIVGSIVGGIAGLYGGWVDTLLMRTTDFFLALPLLPIYLLTVRFIRSLVGAVTWDKVDTFTTALTVGGVFVMFGWMGVGRQVRAAILSLRSRSFIEAARALGASNARVIFRHLLPNAIAPVLVAGTFAVGDFIIVESVLAYFGQGIQDPPTVSWGNLLGNSQDYTWSLTNLNPFQSINGYLVLFPAAMVLITVLCINFIGDALRDALDPHESAV